MSSTGPPAADRARRAGDEPTVRRLKLDASLARRGGAACRATWRRCGRALPQDRRQPVLRRRGAGRGRRRDTRHGQGRGARTRCAPRARREAAPRGGRDRAAAGRALAPGRARRRSVDCLQECLTSGMLTADPRGVAFRHELARLAVEESIAPNRRVELHRPALAALTDPPGGEPDLARLAHHAEAAGTPTRCFASHRRRPRARRRSARIARPPRSTHVRFASVIGCRRPNAPSFSSCARAPAT